MLNNGVKGKKAMYRERVCCSEKITRMMPYNKKSKKGKVTRITLNSLGLANSKIVGGRKGGGKCCCRLYDLRLPQGKERRRFRRRPVSRQCWGDWMGRRERWPKSLRKGEKRGETNCGRLTLWSYPCKGN